jgi:hypothetical protein
MGQLWDAFRAGRTTLAGRPRLGAGTRRRGGIGLSGRCYRARMSTPIPSGPGARGDQAHRLRAFERLHGGSR